MKIDVRKHNVARAETGVEEQAFAYQQSMIYKTWASS